jgi:hypothetical protein
MVAARQPVYMHILCQYGPMAELLKGDLGCALILAIVEPIFYIHGKGEWWKRKARATMRVTVTVRYSSK